MAPVRRLTPDVDFPETQGGTQSYAHAWPLDEDFYLCTFDPAMQVAGLEGKGRYGIYLVDSFGNKELVYRDPEIACQSPIPLRPRPAPPVVPSFSARVPEDQPAEGTVSVMNVYDSQRPWPEGTKIAALRIFQGLPMSVPSGAPPHDTGMRIATAGDSVTMVRYLLGTVPVEADGSAHFVVPARRELFFQAVDDQGYAVQSMRSATQLMPGERQTCQGCHSRRYEAPAAPKVLPLALRRAPSRPVADVDGTNPFSYPRLVQPVLDRHCVKCHQENAPKAPPLDRSLVKLKRTTFYASYVSLAPKWGFWDYKDSYRTTPGKFGARAAPLTALLDKGHYDVRLSPEDRHRINVWLDSCSMFYGVYEKEGGEAQLRGEVARPTLE
jgi:mono/diheme cytochrome c family protein